MAYNHTSSEYTRTYTSFSGCDIVCTFGSVVIGELQAISFSISRERQKRHIRYNGIYLF